jgi:ribosomal protein L30E
METINTLPAAKYIIGTKTIAKGIKSGKIKTVVVSKNTPKALIDKLNSKNVKIKFFAGDEREMATKLGKPFPIAAIGYEE